MHAHLQTLLYFPKLLFACGIFVVTMKHFEIVEWEMFNRPGMFVVKLNPFIWCPYRGRDTSMREKNISSYSCSKFLTQAPKTRFKPFDYSDAYTCSNILTLHLFPRVGVKIILKQNSLSFKSVSRLKMRLLSTNYCSLCMYLFEFLVIV